jgi:hypothetical protein
MWPMARRVGILAAALLLAACVPIPHRVYFAPTISGTITRAGAPVEGADLHLSGNFTKRTATASTDGAGHFKIGPLKTWEATTGLLGDPGAMRTHFRYVSREPNTQASPLAGSGMRPLN